MTMKIKTIKNALSLSEHEQIEFKTSCKAIDSICQTVCAFLNTKGGVIVCGVNAQGEIVGIDKHESHLRTIEQQLSNRITPRSLIEVSAHEIDKKPILLIKIPAGSDVPYICQNHCYLRQGECNIIAD